MLIEWNESLETGVEEIDSDHRYLIALANRIHIAAQAGKREDVADMVLEFCNYCDDHFVMEEEFMRDINYPNRAEHKRDHDQMLTDLDKIMGKVRSNLDASAVMAEFIFRWTANHVLVIERQLADFVRSHAPVA
ncbi:MAG: hemerythrin family protein [Rhodospirillaceae bacterium]